MESNNNLLGQNMVMVKIEYPENYEGNRFHKNGQDYPMAVETANLLVDKGIATILDVFKEEEQVQNDANANVDSTDLGDNVNANIDPMTETKKDKIKPVSNKNAGKKRQ